MTWLSKISQQQDLKMSGPIVDQIIQTVNMMFDRGAPVEINNWGFNQTDYGDYRMSQVRNAIPGTEVSAALLNHATRRLLIYSKTQLPQAIPLRQEFERAHAEAQRQQGAQVQAPQQTEGGEMKVQVLGAGRYGKMRVYVPQMEGRFTANLMNKHLRARAEELGWSRVADNYGRHDYELWKAYSKSKTEIDVIEIKGEFFPALKAAIDEYNTNADTISRRKGLPVVVYDTTELAEIPAEPEPQQPKATLVIERNEGTIGFEFPRGGRPAFTRLLNSFKDLVYDSFGTRPRWNNDDKTWTMFDINKNGLLAISQLFKDTGFDTSQLDATIEAYKEPEVPVQGMQLQTVDVTEITNNQFHLGFRFPRNPRERDVFKELIKYSFPIWNENRTIDKTRWLYNVNGNYNDYIDFIRLCQKNNLDTSQAEALIQQLTESGIIEPSRYDGLLDGFESREEFVNAIEKNNKAEFSLYPKQNDGVEFLYSREAALLGDETGAGKCQIGSTRVNINNSIITLEDLWQNEAKRVVSYEPYEEWGDIDTDLYVHSIDDKHKIVKGKVTNLFRQKYKGKLRVIHTANGKTTTTTFQHKFMTPEGWSNDITKGDVIAFAGNLPSLNNSNNTSPEMAEFMGWLIAEGHEDIKSNRIRISQNDKRILKRLKSIFDNKIKPHIKGKANCFIADPKNRCSYLHITSKAFVEHLKDMGYEYGHLSREKSIPQFIMNSSDEAVASFLRAMFTGEAYCSKTSRRIEFTSASQNIIFSLSQLLGRFNILCSFGSGYKCATNGSKTFREYYRLYIIGSGVKKFIEKIGFDSFYKTSSIIGNSSKENPNKEGKPIYLALQSFFHKYSVPYRLLNIPAKNYISGKRWATNKVIQKVIVGFESLLKGETLNFYLQQRKTKWTNSTVQTLESIKTQDIEKTIAQLNRLLLSDLYYEKVIKVETIDFDGYVYDLSIENHHNYISENLITHNTAQSVLAAKMRIKESGGKVLIVTLAATQNQWASEIAKWAGDTDVTVPKGAADFFPTVVRNPKTKERKEKPAKIDINQIGTWLVLTYPMFSAPKNGERLKELLRTVDFTVEILDEIHTVKNESKRTERILDLGQDIPFRWGASATISANRPIDVWRQLKAVGHRLGDVSHFGFRTNFAGQKQNRWGGWEPISEEAVNEAAMNLSKWLKQSGVYMRRSKKDMNPNMPNHIIQDLEVSLSDAESDKLTTAVAERMETYKDPGLAISHMIANRTELARHKVPYSVELASNVLDQDKKVIIFTCFVESAQDLTKAMQKAVNQRGGGEVVTVIGGTQNRQELVQKFKTDPNTKVLVLSILAGGTGLDVPNVVDDVIINDFSWTPKDAEQSEGRAFRISSENDVTTRYVVAKDTPDEDFFTAVQEKRRIAKIIDNPTNIDELRKARERLQEIDKTLMESLRKRSKKSKKQASTSWLTKTSG